MHKAKTVFLLILLLNGPGRGADCTSDFASGLEGWVEHGSVSHESGPGQDGTAGYARVRRSDGVACSLGLTAADGEKTPGFVGNLKEIHGERLVIEFWAKDMDGRFGVGNQELAVHGPKTGTWRFDFGHVRNSRWIRFLAVADTHWTDQQARAAGWQPGTGPWRQTWEDVDTISCLGSTGPGDSVDDVAYDNIRIATFRGGLTTFRTVDEPVFYGLVRAVDPAKVLLTRYWPRPQKDIEVHLIDLDRVEFPPRAEPEDQPGTWEIRLVGGDRLVGKLRSWTDDRLTVKMEQRSQDVELAVPRASIVEFWQAGIVQPAQAMRVISQDEDVAYVTTKEGSQKAVKGRCLGIQDGSLRFEFNRQARRIALNRLRGVVLAGPVDPPVTFHQRVAWSGGLSVRGHLHGLSDDQNLVVKMMWGALLSIPLDQVAHIWSMHGRRVYLSQLTPSLVEQVPFFDRMMQYQVDRSLSGASIRLNDGEHLRGIAVHSRTVLHYDLAGRYDSFRSIVGFQQPTGMLGQADIHVIGDDRTLFECLDARGEEQPVRVDVNVRRIKTLRLEVDFGNGQDVADRVVWADAQLIRAVGKGGEVVTR